MRELEGAGAFGGTGAGDGGAGDELAAGVFVMVQRGEDVGVEHAEGLVGGVVGGGALEGGFALLEGLLGALGVFLIGATAGGVGGPLAVVDFGSEHFGVGLGGGVGCGG